MLETYVLDGTSDVLKRVARDRGRDARKHGRARRIHESTSLRASVTHDPATRRIAVPAVHDGTTIDRDDLARTDGAPVGDAMDDFVTEGHTEAVPEWAEVARNTDEGRDAATRTDQALGDRVQLERGDTRFDRLSDLIESVTDQAACLCHALDLGL
jgi:hypothetical protein